MPEWTTADLIPYICRHIDDVHALAALSETNKAFNQYLFSTTGGKHWIRAGRLVCGEEYWNQDKESLQLEETDPRYLTKIRICPWISEPVDIYGDERYANFDHDIWSGIKADQKIVTRMNNTQWAPSFGDNYGKISDIMVLHEGVYIVRLLFDKCSYFVSSRNLKLLRDCFYLVNSNADTKSWSVWEGKLYLYTYNRDNSSLLYFGIRQDKATTPLPPPEHSGKVIQAFWMAFRGEVIRSGREIVSVLGDDIDWSTLNCRDETYAHHIIAGGSYCGLKVLLHRDPSCVNMQTMIHALGANREDMAMLIASKISPSVMNPSRWLWFTLTDNTEELKNDPIEEVEREEYTGFDLNLFCIDQFKYWIRESNYPRIARDLTMLCSVCARARIPTSDGKYLSDIVKKYLIQLTDSYDNDENIDDDGVEEMLKYKTVSILRLLCYDK